MRGVPEAPTAAKRRAMQRQRERDTKPELELRRELHRLGLRYRVQRCPLPTLRRKLDVVFGPSRVVVDVHGCFWHSCPEHATRPKTNRAWWDEKLATNRRRDEDTARRLADEGWLLVVVWEHEDPAIAAQRVHSTVTARRPPALRRVLSGIEPCQYADDLAHLAQQ